MNNLKKFEMEEITKDQLQEHINTIRYQVSVLNKGIEWAELTDLYSDVNVLTEEIEKLEKFILTL